MSKRDIVWTALIAAALAVFAVAAALSNLFVDADGVYAAAKVCVGAAVAFAILSLRE